MTSEHSGTASPGTGATGRTDAGCRMNRELPALPPEDPSRKENPKAKSHPWRAWMPGYLRERSPQWQEKRRG